MATNWFNKCTQPTILHKHCQTQKKKNKFLQRKRTPLKIGSRIVAACISNGDTQSHTNETVWNLNCYNRIKYNANPQMFGSKLYFDSMFCWYLCGVRAKKKRFTGKRAATIQKTCNQISTFPFFTALPVQISARWITKWWI